MPLGIWDMSLAERTQHLQKLLPPAVTLLGQEILGHLSWPQGCLTHAMCRKRKLMTFSDKPGLHIPFHSSNDSSSSLVPHVSRERSLAICAQQSHHAAGCPLPGRRSFPGRPLHIPAELLQSSHCSHQVTQFILPAY